MVMMRTETIYFPHRQALSVFPDERSNLAQAIAELGLKGRYPVIVLIGGEIAAQQADLTRRAIEMISRTAENLHAVVICGGTDMGVMAEIGQIRGLNHYKFPLVGIAPKELVIWPGGPHSTKFLWWGKKRWQLEPHFSHFILVPGSQFGDESPWIVDTATMLSKDYRSVTILINGGEVSRKDIQLSLEKGRPVIALSRTGRLADELARQPERNNLITILPVSAVQSIAEAVRAALSMKERIEEAITFKSLIQEEIDE
jgi:TRPM family ion channel